MTASNRKFHEWEIRDILMRALDEKTQHALKCDEYVSTNDVNDVGFIAVDDDGSSFKISIVRSLDPNFKDNLRESNE